MKIAWRFMAMVCLIFTLLAALEKDYTRASYYIDFAVYARVSELINS
jgi:hypothetical protein